MTTEHECIDCGHHWVPERIEDDWDRIDLGDIAARIRSGEYSPIVPTVLAVLGHLALFYRGSDVLKVFTSNCPPLHAEETYTLWGFHVAMEHGGDFAKAASAVRTSMQVAAGAAAAPAARVATTTTTAVACPHCGSTNTKERVA